MMTALEASDRLRLGSTEATACWGLKVQAAVSELRVRASEPARKALAFVPELELAAVPELELAAVPELELAAVPELELAAVVAEAERAGVPVAQASKSVGLKVAVFWAVDSAEMPASKVRATKQKK